MVTVESGDKVQIKSRTLQVVALKKGHSHVGAPNHTEWGTLKCELCEDEFVICPPRWFAVFEGQRQYMQRLEQILSDEHRQCRRHQDSYRLGC